MTTTSADTAMVDGGNDPRPPAATPSSSNSMTAYLLHVSSSHPTFRIPELLSCAKAYDFPIQIIWEGESRPFVLVGLRKDGHARKLAERCMAVRSVSRLLAHADTYPSIHDQLRPHPELWQPHKTQTFAFVIEAVGHRKVEGNRFRKVVDSFAYMDLLGRVDLKRPEVSFMVIEEYEIAIAGTLDSELARDGSPRHIWFSTLVAYGSARKLIDRFEVRRRAFFGTTSMEAEMSLVMANQALAREGSLVYDPFAGTGSLLYTSAHFGATVLGSDIDGRQMRGKDRLSPGVFRTADQYGIRDRFLDCYTFDVTSNPWRRGGWVDAIVTDPPYGVRAGAKRLGRPADAKRKLAETPTLMPDGRYSHQLPGYIPPHQSYEMVDLVYDLVLFARWILVPGGRLVFFLPTSNEDYDSVDVPVVEGMKEVKWKEGSAQDFGRWSRRLITIEKDTTLREWPRPDFRPVIPSSSTSSSTTTPSTTAIDETAVGREAVPSSRTPGHAHFRERYHAKFEKLEIAPASSAAAGDGPS